MSDNAIKGALILIAAALISGGVWHLAGAAWAVIVFGAPLFFSCMI
jgi:hypothetical protein